MTASKDRKGVNPSVLIPEEEQSTFGQQSPYAAGFNDAPSPSSPIHSPSILSAPPTATTSSQLSAATSPQQQHPTAAPTAPSEVPAQQDAQHYPEDDHPPPAYDEVAQPPRAPQNYYGDNNNHGYTNPSAPLLPSSGPPVTSYATIPPATPYTPGSPRSTYGGSDDGSRRFNKFWLIFLAVVVFLSIVVDDDDDTEKGGCGAGFTRSLYTHSVPVNINDIYILANGIPTTVILEQRDHAGEDPDMSEFAIFATGRDRDDFRKISTNTGVDPSRNHFIVEFTRKPQSGPTDCMSATIRFSLSPRMRVMERLKIVVDEGNVTLAMLLPSHPLLVKELNTRVVTGYTRVNANVTAMALGGSDGSIEGNMVVGSTMSVLMVDGYVSLNVSQSTDVMTGKVSVTNGNIDVGLMTPFVGTFRVESGSGPVDICNVDRKTTMVKYESDRALKGWRTETGQMPRGTYSSLKLNTHAGTAELDMARQIAS